MECQAAAGESEKSIRAAGARFLDLGLAIVHDGALAQGGTAYAENRVGGGLRVTMTVAR